MELQLKCRIEYRLGAEGHSSLHHMMLPLEPGTRVERPDFTLQSSWDGEVLRLVIIPRTLLQVHSFQAEFAHSFTDCTKVLFNGYQSWTDTVELEPTASMRGLHGTPKGVVDRFALDGSGDYRFKEYSAEPGQLHGWTYAYGINDRGCSLIASMGEEQGFTCLQMDADAKIFIAQREAPRNQLATDKPCELLALAFVQRPSLDEAFQQWFGLMGVAPRTLRPLAGYSSWYSHYGDITDGLLKVDLRGAKRAFASLDASGFDRVFQVDDGYTLVGDWLQPIANRFPYGMAPLAAAISDAGFTPGIWCAPFVCEEKSRLFHEHHDWLLKDEEGQPVRTGSHWSGAYALDVLNPNVQEYVRQVLGTMVNDWGFKLLKLDFLYAACMLPRQGLNRGQIMARAIRLLREAAGESALLNGCGVPLGSTFGKLDYCRIGCDVGSEWNGKPGQRMTERERVSTVRSLRNTVYRSPLNRRAFMADPDVVFLREDTKMSTEQRQLLLDGDACFGGMLLTSDDMGQWDELQLAQFQGALDLMRGA